MLYTSSKTENDSSAINSEANKEMLEARVCYGHRSSRTNPRMKPFIIGTKNGVEIIDLDKTSEGLEKAKKVIDELGAKNKMLLFVGTNPMLRDIVKEVAGKTKCLHIDRWVGGLLTNFKTIYGRLQYLRELQEKDKTGGLAKYTKKEQLMFQREIIKLSQMFSGFEDCHGTPDALIVVDVKMHEDAIREGKKLKLPIVGIVDTDSDPTVVDYPIPANDHIRSSVQYLLNQLVSGYNRVVDAEKQK